MRGEEKRDTSGQRTEKRKREEKEKGQTKQAEEGREQKRGWETGEIERRNVRKPTHTHTHTHRHTLHVSVFSLSPQMAWTRMTPTPPRRHAPPPGAPIAPRRR